MSFFILVATSLCAAQPPAPPPSPYAMIDRHALLAPAEVEQSQDRLVAYLIKPADGDREKARVLFRWIADRIRYDVDSLLTSHSGDLRPEVILQARKATCFGYAALYENLARRAGLEVATIPGFFKGITPLDETKPFRPNHAWNAVKIDGRWQFVDCCLGAGMVRGQWHRKILQDQFFLPRPEVLVLTHLPLDPRWQLLPSPVTPQQWDATPSVDSQVVRFGFTLDSLLAKPKPGEPIFKGIRHQIHPLAHHSSARILAAPLGNEIPAGYEYYFLIDASDIHQIAFVQKNQWTFLRKTGTRFEGTYTPVPGELRVNVQRHATDRTAQSMLIYKVNER